MKIKSIEIDGLLGNSLPSRHELNPDLNVLTGRNGSGKTSVLKLIWAIISGNILIALQEIEFQRARIITTDYDCIVHKIGPRTCKVELKIGDRETVFEDEGFDDDHVFSNAEDGANDKLRTFGSSVFFPTFRRIEGGFTISAGKASGAIQRPTRARADLEEALITLSRNLSHEAHIFVSAISTVDIVTLLLRQYADLSQESNKQQAVTSRSIIDLIKASRPSGMASHQLASANATLDEVISQIESMEIARATIMAPMVEVQNLVEKLFRHTGIKFGNRMNFGDAATAINSDVLSAGEKQMLSFVFYNAFYKDSVILIDEPELSLHVDWQRQLFPILQRQQSTNQFIIATHSPFIYAKFPDKEIEIASDRGDTE